MNANKDVDGECALMCGVSSGNIELVRLLLDHGADIRGKNIRDFTAIHQHDTDEKTAEIIKFLIDRGVDKSVEADWRDSKGKDQE